MLFAHGLSHVLLVSPVRYLARLPLLLELGLVPRFNLVQVLQVEFLPVPHMIIHDVLHVTQLSHSSFLVQLRLLLDIFDFTLPLVLYLCHLSCFLL